ncbi:MAG: hypothetical protein JWM88_2698 [Verrucomicrobia bacterium]|nr:hypothetical protein [Verrucomicrobiota bacterium]
MNFSPASFGVPRRILVRAGLWFPFLVAALYAAGALLGFVDDTFQVTTTAFAVLFGFTGVFFAFGRVLDDEDELRDKVVFSGERALHGSLYMLTAAVIEFGFQHGEKFLTTHIVDRTMLNAARMLGNGLVFLFFIVALSEGHRAMRTMYGILEARRDRLRDDVK